MLNVALCMRTWREVRNFAWHRHGISVHTCLICKQFVSFQLVQYVLGCEKVDNYVICPFATYAESNLRLLGISPDVLICCYAEHNVLVLVIYKAPSMCGFSLQLDKTFSTSSDLVVVLFLFVLKNIRLSKSFWPKSRVSRFTCWTLQQHNSPAD